MTLMRKLFKADIFHKGKRLTSSTQGLSCHCSDFDADAGFLTDSIHSHPLRQGNGVTTSQDLNLGNSHFFINDEDSVNSSSEENAKIDRCATLDEQVVDPVTNDEEMPLENTIDIKYGTEFNEVDYEGPLTVKERMNNIDLSIEWIKTELLFMKAEGQSLVEQYEKLFKEIIDLKLRMEMTEEDDKE